MIPEKENSVVMQTDEEYYLKNIRLSSGYDGDGNELPDDIPVPVFRDEPVPPAQSLTSAEKRRLRVAKSVRMEALRRLELSARTVEEFQTLTARYDREEQSRMRKERRYESLRGDVPLEYGMVPDGDPVPAGHSQPTFRQICRGEFDDYLLNCLFTMHDLTEREHICRIVKDLKTEHKEILYFLGIRYYSTFLLAELRGQSERNIRKVRDTVQRKIRKKLFAELAVLQRNGTELTHRELKFLKDYPEEKKGDDGEHENGSV